MTEKRKKVGTKKTKIKNKKKGTLETKQIYYGIMIIAYLYLIIACMYKYMRYESLEKCLLELVLILILSLFAQYMNVTNSEKKDLMFRKKLSKKPSLKTRVKYYLGECNIFALTLTSIVFLAISLNKIEINFYNFYVFNIAFTIIMCAFLSYLVFLAISFAGNYLISERIIKKYQN